MTKRKPKFANKYEQYSNIVAPETQFVNALFEEHPRVESKFKVTRRIRVSAGTKLSVFQDKVLTPCMGWDRNLHAYVFHDFRDGALYGPENCWTNDMQHRDCVGWDWLEESRYTLAHILQEAGDEMEYTYDFGDRWKHIIRLEEVLSAENSTGETVLLEGTGACPPENARGNYNFGAYLEEWYFTADKQRKDAITYNIIISPNHSSNKSLSILNYDPAHFDLLGAQRRLGVALSSKLSVRRAPKQYFVPISGPSDSLSPHHHMAQGPGFSVERTADPSQREGQWIETKAHNIDAKGERSCQVCGKSDGLLSKCSSCKRVSYCSVEHQRENWPFHKPECKKFRALAAADAAAGERERQQAAGVSMSSDGATGFF